MTILRLTYRLILIAVCIFYGMAEMFFLFPVYSKQRKLRAIQLWSRRVLAACGMELSVYGTLPSQGVGSMIIANHISWLDIMAVNAAFPNRFVAKDDVAKWPLVGYLATQAQTVYVARNKGSSGNSDKLRTVTDALKNGDTVTLFPEGTSSEGRSILPFKTSFFQAAFEARTPLIPVLCRYPNPDGSSPNPAAAYYGDISLVQSIKMICSRRSSKVELHFLPPVLPEGDRRQCAQAVRTALERKQRALG
ncbi:lysophospholipid acyltransferase family protein [Neisseria animalis]|uniref:1-acyl-sn-glycerol-3-phosphate acyltransferase n=1 Tax=Neisseria animalis TaxID=492 RepID=A0A5P3MTG2_NEIAN|nr:lysophospholipid acyltransferase family protein [Neisseria animalis]QEY24061.1 1-acyl-sn-glycerol-3-phosphate acyltransferase [Neisseria animalis]ROW32628.1 1-acyl-sn-glycerol-3-phosphate acyltransferase [Neisseria animalis]VEE06194.1 1-acyl-SN-glycerol-3-phosphate acyltransferase [Neisseria animalis]